MGWPDPGIDDEGAEAWALLSSKKEAVQTSIIEFFMIDPLQVSDTVVRGSSLD